MLRSVAVPKARTGLELKLELIMRRAVAFALFTGLLALPVGALADDAPAAKPSPDLQSEADRPKSAAPPKAAPASSRTDAGPSPVAITAKRVHPRLDLRLSSDRLTRVLYDSGVQPIAESDAEIETVEVTAHHVQREPITQGIPAIYYGITHPTEAWRIFAPIQP